MDEQDVDPVHAEALHAVLVGAHDAIVGVVEERLERERVLPLAARLLSRAPGAEAAADLGREHPAAAVAQLVPDQVLGAAVAVERRRVEIADAGSESLDHHQPRIGIVHRLHAAAERGAAKSEDGDVDGSASDPPDLEFHPSPIPTCRDRQAPCRAICRP